MTILTLVAARSLNNVIGINGKLPWNLPDDLKRFKLLTQGHTVIMGRKTWESLPDSVRPLPRRTCVVLTRDTKYVAKGAVVIHSIEDVLNIQSDTPFLFCIGGGEIYEQLLPHAKYIVLTTIQEQVEGDSYFPEIDPEEWKVLTNSNYYHDPEHNVHYQTSYYERTI